MKILDSIQNYIKYWIISFFVLPFFFWWFSLAVDDLTWQVFYPAKSIGSVFNLGDNVNTVWNRFIKWSTEISIGSSPKRSPSIIVKVTRFLLILVITLSVTMILYNWLIYIIQTWQGKEWKSLIKNVLLIVVGILVALFSVVIINLIQSVPTTIDTELQAEKDNESDNKVLRWENIGWNDIRKALWNTWDTYTTEEEVQNAVYNEALDYFTGNSRLYKGSDGDWMVRWLDGWTGVTLIQAFLNEKL